MDRNILKKLVLVLFILVISFFALDGIDFKGSLKATSYQDTSSWKAHDLGFTPQVDVNYESNYLPFSDITVWNASMDLTKTYVIESAYDLYMLSELSRGLNRSTYLSLNYVLGRSIDYYEIVQQNIASRFIPIGFIEPFSGTFDGQGYEITNLFFQTILSEDEYNESYPGLRFFSMFSRVSSTGVVKNLGLINPIIIQPIEWGIMEHVSYLAGENFGTIENVYMIDTRQGTSGLNVEGSFRLSGLVSINRGTFRNSFISAPHVKSVAVVDNESVSPVTYLNQGTLQNVYYDASLYSDLDALLTYGTPLVTSGFQNPAIFSTTDFYFNNHYHLLAGGGSTTQLSLNNTYPILQGLKVNQGKLEIENAVDFVYFNELLKVSGAFRSAHYQIVNDIDMNQVARTAYKAAPVGFDGILSSAPINGTKLYNRHISQGGDILYHTILNLKITTPTQLGNYASYALFSALFGQVKNINFVNLEVITEGIELHTSRSKIVVAAIAGQMSAGLIENVHVHGDILVTGTTNPMTRLYVAGLVAEGRGKLQNVSTNGTIHQATQVYDARASLSATAGLVAKSDLFEINYAHNAMDVTGLSFTSSNLSTLYLGGVVGLGNLSTMEKVVNSGYLYSGQSLGFIKTMFAGGIIGYQQNQYGLVKQVFNDGNIDIYANEPVSLSLSGYGFVDGTSKSIDASYQYQSITNDGRLRVLLPTNNYTPAQLATFNIQMSGVMRTTQINATFKGLFNERDFVLDLSLVKRFAGVLDMSETTGSEVTQAYNTGHLSFISANTIIHPLMKFSGVVLGENIDYKHLRNDGNITVDINHQTSSTTHNLHVYGVIETVNQNRVAEDLFNGGDLTITSNLFNPVTLNLFVSGILYSNQNTNYYQQNNISTTSIENITGIHGPIDNLLNDGNILIEGEFNGSSRASGIVLVNSSLVTTAINLGNIENKADIYLSSGENASAGIAYLLQGQFAQVKDSANQGNITSVSTTTLGFAHAAGIAVRNDLTSSFVPVTSGSMSKYAKVIFSINYGSIYAFSGTDESLYTYQSETRSKAAGIFGMGLASVINTINYGNVYSKYLSSGIIGFVYMNRFGAIQKNQVYFANNINYGYIRNISSYDGSFSINMYQVPTRQIFNAYGSFIGKFHTGSETWEFVSISPTAIYPLDNMNFGYHANMDPLVDVIGNNPVTTLDPSLFDSSAPGNTAIMEIVDKMATVKTQDTSVSPFAGKTFGSPPQNPRYSKSVRSYQFNETLDGIFSNDYIFRRLPIRTSGTDKYLRGYFSYVPRNKTNLNLVQSLEAYRGNQYPGLYVLSSSEGINNGIFIPNHLELAPLNPYDLILGVDTSWIGSVTIPGTISYKLVRLMNQLETTFGTTIYDMEIIQTDSSGNPITNGLKLTRPVIDDERALITFYLPSNATILTGVQSQQLQTVNFVEVSPGVAGARKVPDYYDTVAQQWVYKWVGTHKKVGDNYVAIGPYDLAGTYNITTTSGPVSSSYSRTNQITRAAYNRLTVDTAGTLSLNFVFQHVHHQYYIQGNQGSGNYRYNGYGYEVNSFTTHAAGYAPYRLITYSNPNNETVPWYINGTYQYVGPSKEAVTYVQTPAGAQTIYDQANIFFRANTETGSYLSAQGSSFKFNGSGLTSNITIPRALGIYDVIYASPSGAIIDKLDYHHGTVRVFSSEYNASDPLTYKDYQIRIVRTANQFLSSLNSVILNGSSAMPSYSNFRDITLNQMIHFEQSGDLGTLRINYSIMNASDGYALLPMVKLYNHLNTEINPTLYELSNGIIENNNSFNNLTGVWGLGSGTIEFAVTDKLPSGTYRLELKLVTGEIAQVTFQKVQSANGAIIILEHQGRTVSPIGTTFTSIIPYGLFYQALDAQTKPVNFTNLTSLVGVYQDDIELGLFPSYLDAFNISPFATLQSVALTNIQIFDGYRHRYTLTYQIQAENGSLYTYTHILEEAAISSAPVKVYQDGGEVEQPIDELVVQYFESPTIRIELDVDYVYLPNGSVLLYEFDFTEFNGYGIPVLNQDYFLSYIDEVGYQIDLAKQTPIGTYYFNAIYQNEVTLWGHTLSWMFTFDVIEVEKVQNSQSLIQNVLFVSDTLFSGFNTIVDVQELTEMSYMSYLQNPETRPMSVLPTTGIFYGNYAGYPTYWIIGQVQRTNLSIYAPTFVLPDNAIIRRVVDPNNIGPEYQSTNLFTDFSVADGVFNYVRYRVYAQDYNVNPSNYTDYYIAVQDVTNNIKFNLTVINNTEEIFDRVHVKVNVCRVAEGMTCGLSDYLLQMSVFSYYQSLTASYSNNQFQTSTYGTYIVHVDLPRGYTYHLSVQEVTIDGSAFYLEDSLLPRKYYVTVYIEYEGYVPSWGHESVQPYRPMIEMLQEGYTYQAGMMFNYNGITWLVQEGYTYLYDMMTPPGTLGLLGVRNISSLWNQYSTYTPGDIIQYLGVTYVAQSVNQNLVPDLNVGEFEAWMIKP